MKDDPRIHPWFSYPGVSVMLQRTQSVVDLLEEINTQAVQERKDILSPGSTLAETIKEADALLNKIQVSSAAMASASVGPVVVSLVLKLLQKADTAILRAGGTTPRVPVLINRMMAKTSWLIHNRNQEWPERCTQKLSDRSVERLVLDH